VERKTKKPETGNPTTNSGEAVTDPTETSAEEPVRLLDARERPALESSSDFSSGVGRWVERNPIVSAVTFFGVGLIAGMLVGASVARE
jgi:hypothetical protein